MQNKSTKKNTIFVGLLFSLLALYSQCSTVTLIISLSPGLLVYSFEIQLGSSISICIQFLFNFLLILLLLFLTHRPLARFLTVKIAWFTHRGVTCPVPSPRFLTPLPPGSNQLQVTNCFLVYFSYVP